MIEPTADAENEDFRDGVIEGYHNAGADISLHRVLNEEEIQTHSTGCKNADWCRGWAAGYRVRLVRWHEKQANDERAAWENEGGHAGQQTG